MPCPLHPFAPVGHCCYCNMFCGGFTQGFFFYPTRLYKGLFQSSPDIVKQAGRDLRTVYALTDKYPPCQDHVDRAQQAYRELPPAIQEGVQLGLAQAAGSFLGGVLASMVVAAGLGRGASRLAVATLGPSGTLHAPYWQRMTGIFAGGLLSWYAMMGTTVDYVQRRNQLMQQLPPPQRLTIEQIIEELLRDRNPHWKDPGNDPSGSKKHQ